MINFGVSKDVFRCLLPCIDLTLQRGFIPKACSRASAHSSASTLANSDSTEINAFIAELRITEKIPAYLELPSL